MKETTLKRWAGAFFILAFGILASWLLLVGKPTPKAAPIPNKMPPLVSYVLAEPQTMQLSVRTQGTVEPVREVVLSTELGGRIVSVTPQFIEGGFFRAGEPLLQLETADYESAILQAESRLATAKQELAQEEGRARQAEREWSELANSKANDLFLRKPQLASAKAAVAAAEAELQDAQRALANTAVSLPFDGRIVSRNVGLGQFVTPGTSIAVVYGTERVHVRLPINDEQLALLDLPLTASGREEEEYPKVSLRTQLGGKLHEWLGIIRRTDARVDQDSRNLYAIAEIDQPFESQQGFGSPPLLPGLFVEAEIEGRPIDGLTRLPRSAMQNDDTLRVVDSESTIRERLVRSLYQDNLNVWIPDLVAGERIVVSNSALLQVGTAVTAVLTEQLAFEGF